MSERNRVVYVTSEGPLRWLAIDFPFGMITPPTLELHVPVVGPVTFYYADCYHLPVPAEAKVAT